MTDNQANTMFVSSTMVGRLYGQSSDEVCYFDIDVGLDMLPIIVIRHMTTWSSSSVITVPPDAHLLVQLFEQPNTLWLISATILNEEPVIRYAPVEPLISADNRCEMPELAAVSPEQLAEGIEDAVTDRDAMHTQV